MTTIDLNADLGEGFGRWTLTDDAGLLDQVTSANVACGFHAGDPRIMDRVCRMAAERGVAIGAHVSYRDRAGFGRRFIDIEPADLVADTLYQIGALEAFARAAGTRVAYVKPHGALYNAVVHHEGQASALVTAVQRYDGQLDVLGLPGSRWLALAQGAGLRAVAEGFVDRGYTRQGTLVPRSQPGAFVDPDVRPERAVRLAMQGRVGAVDGTEVVAPVESLCVHGDSPQALRTAAAIRGALEAADVVVRAFVAQ